MALKILNSNSSSTDPLGRICDGIAGGVRVFIIKGAAGTGKTTQVKRLVACFGQNGYSVSLLAPTGRAAKILQLRTGHAASTIHSAIYKINDKPIEGKDGDEDLKWIFPLKSERPSKTVFIVDEASMVGLEYHKDEILQFGSGSLLKDLLTYSGIRQAESENMLIFVGDSYQLPPVGEKADNPPALDEGKLRELGAGKVISMELTEIYRQREDSGIIDVAQKLRSAISAKQFGFFRYEAQSDIRLVNEDLLKSTYHPERNLNDKIIICYTNQRVWQYNMCIRRLLGYDVTIPNKGEHLLSLRNTMVGNSEDDEVKFMNGDMLKVIAVDNKNLKKLHGFYHPKGQENTLHYEFTFCKMRVGWLNEDDREEVGTWLNITPIVSEGYRENPEYANIALYVAVTKWIQEICIKKGIKFTKELISEQLKRSVFYRAPWVTFGYAITGHKAQGGEWKEVWIDYSYPQKQMNEAYFRWMYTTTTRAREVLFAIAPPQLDDLAEALERGIGQSGDNAGVQRSNANGLPLATILLRHGYSIANKTEQQYKYRIQLGKVADQLAMLGTLDICYNGKNAVTYVKWDRNDADDAFGEEIAALKGRSIKSLFPDERRGAQDNAPEIKILDVHARIGERLKAAAEKSGLRVIALKSISQYQIRLELSSEMGDGSVDFYVNAGGRVTEMGTKTISGTCLRKLLDGLTAKDGAAPRTTGGNAG